MRIIRNITLIIAAVATLGVASAQHFRFGGLVMDHDGMMPADMYKLSQTGFGFGSARSMAMAGAFTSLGGDYASVGINPAGLGMYRHNEFTLTPMMTFHSANTTSAMEGAQNFGENGGNRFSIANMGLVLNTFESSDESGLMTFNIAFGYNRIADLNYRYGFSSLSAPSEYPYRSIADMFSRQMGQGGLFPGNNGSLGYDYGDAYYWGGALAYNGYLLDVEQVYNPETGKYEDCWTTANRIGVNASVGHTTEVESRGSVGEFDVAFGMNYANKLYFGMTFGVQMVDWRRRYYYSEDYLYQGLPLDADGRLLDGAAEWMDYYQGVNMSGVGMIVLSAVCVWDGHSTPQPSTLWSVSIQQVWRPTSMPMATRRLCWRIMVTTPGTSSRLHECSSVHLIPSVVLRSCQLIMSEIGIMASV